MYCITVSFYACANLHIYLSLHTVCEFFFLAPTHNWKTPSAHSFYHTAIDYYISTPGWVGTDARITVVEGASNFSTFVTRMSTPVIASAWAGTFDCGTCRRKRLMGEEFSKKALERHYYRKEGGAPLLKCIQCVTAAERAEREQAQQQARRRNNNQKSNNNFLADTKNSDDDDDDDDERRKCAGYCGNELPQSSFNRNQWSKGDGKSRCGACVDRAVKEEAARQTNSREDKLASAKKQVEEAEKSGNSMKILAATSMLAALEAERVTGLKPVKLSSGRGRGRGGRGGGGGVRGMR